MGLLNVIRAVQTSTCLDRPYVWIDPHRVAFDRACLAHDHLSSSDRTGQHRNSAIQNASNLAGAFEEHLSRTLTEIDRTIKAIRTSYSKNPDTFDLRGWLQSNELFDDQTVQVSIISKDGFIKLSSIASSTSVGTDLRDREHFQFQAKAEGDPLFISKPVIGRTTGKWSVQLTRRMQNADGKFNGMIVVSLDPAYLARFYSSVNLGENGYVRVIGNDGIIRAMGGAKASSLGINLSGADLFKNYPARKIGSYFTPRVASATKFPGLLHFVH